ncbi:MAG: hypothetical protein IH840_13035 [Candidatus Heimdallarchaeota archaeon]|nr:hypothetical protein [Candidatus Heimdallarchaeota archaeon]
MEVSLIYIITGVISIPPALSITKYYRQTKIIDFAHYSVVFFFTFGLFPIGLLSLFDLGITVYVILLKFLFAGFILIWMFVFLFLTKIIWEKPPILLTGGVTLIGIALLIIILFSKPIDPSLYIDPWGSIPHNNFFTASITIGFVTNSGILLFSSNQAIIFLIYSVLLSIFKIYVYSSSNIPGLANTHYKREHLIAQMFVFCTFVFWLPWIKLNLLGTICGLLFVVSSTYIAIRHPENILINHVQITRALKLYQMQDKTEKRLPILIQPPVKLVEYLELAQRATARIASVDHRSV